MALKTEYAIRCSCGAAFTGEVFEYVLAEHDPELKDAILSGGFNRVACPSCGNGLPVGTRYLYRDETNRFSVWVCPREDEARKEELARELIDGNAPLELHFTEGTEPGRRHLVFGREALIGLLLREDPLLKKSEKGCLKRNPAVRLIMEDPEDPGYLLLRGKKIRVAIPLRFPGSIAGLPPGPEARKKWLKHYSLGMNIHNAYSSFLDKRMKSVWDRIQGEEPSGNAENEYDDFAGSWAYGEVDPRGFRARYPGRRGFFDGLKGMEVAREVRPLRAGRPETG